MNIVIVADKEFNDYVFLRRKLDALTKNLKSDPFLITVQQHPTRKLVENFATERFLYMQVYHAEDKSLEAEIDRDREAIEAATTDYATQEECKAVVIMFSTGSGSEHLKRIREIATKHGIEVRRIFYSEDD